MAEIAYRPFSRRHREVRLIVRRTKPTPGTQRALLATYDYHAFVTNREGDTIGLDAGNRRHGVCEVTIRDLKYGVGLNHLPSGRFAANAAWMAFNLIAHNLGRWTERIGLGRQAAPMTTKTHSGPGCSPCRGGSPPRAENRPFTCPPAGPGKTSSTPCLDNLRAVVVVA